MRPFPWSWGSPGAPTGLDVLMLHQIVKAAVILGWFVLEVSLCSGLALECSLLRPECSAFAVLVTESFHGCAGTCWQQQEHPTHFPSAASTGLASWDLSGCVMRGSMQPFCPHPTCLPAVPGTSFLAGAALCSIIPNPSELFTRCLYPEHGQRCCMPSAPLLWLCSAGQEVDRAGQEAAPHPRHAAAGRAGGHSTREEAEGCPSNPLCCPRYVVMLGWRPLPCC